MLQVGTIFSLRCEETPTSDGCDVKGEHVDRENTVSVASKISLPGPYKIEAECCIVDSWRPLCVDENPDSTDRI